MKKILQFSTLLIALATSLAYAENSTPFPTQHWETFHESAPFTIQINTPKIPYQFKLWIQVKTNVNNKNDIIYRENFGNKEIVITPNQTITYLTSNTCSNKNGCDDTLLFTIKSCEVNCYAIGSLTYNFISP